jgi:NADP-dependent aldehyde dehydrogenase
MNIELTGTSIIGSARGAKTGETFRAFDPSTGKAVSPDFYSASLDELNSAAELAGQARIAFGNISPKQRAKFLRTIADNIEALGDTLIERASLETALPIGAICRGKGTDLRATSDVCRSARRRVMG